jgi:outer membrane protein
MVGSRRGGLLAAVSSVIALGLAGPASAETLADAIALAYENNPTLQAQRAAQRALDENWVQARTGWRPTLGLNGTASYSGSRIPMQARTGLDVNGDGLPDSDGSPEQTRGSVTLRLTQPVWTGGRVAANVSAAEAEVLAGRENLRRIEQQILQNVITAYVDVRRDQEGLRIRSENVQVLQRQLEESRARFEVGEITRTDVAQSEARLAASQAQYQLAQSQLATSRASYAAVVGQNPGDLAPEPSMAGLLPSDPDLVFDSVERFNPNVRAAEFTEQASRARIAGARAERLPNVSLDASLGHSGGPLDPFDRRDYSRNVTATATVSVPLFSGGLVSSRIRQSVERNNVDRLNVEANRRTALQQATQSWNALQAARANIVSTEEQVRAARIAAEGTRQEQQVGLRTTLDVLNAEQELRAAELSQINARREEYVAATAVLGAMGRLEAQNLVPTVEIYDPKANFRKLRFTWGWVPWEEPISVIDSLLTPQPVNKPAPPPVAATPIATPPAPAAGQ